MGRARWPTWADGTGLQSAAARLILVLACALGPVAAPALAQAENPATGSTVRVANTGGQNLNLRSGPGTDQPIQAKLPGGESLTVTGPVRTVGGARWLPVTTASGRAGWVAAEYVVVVTGPAAAPLSLADAASDAASRAASAAAARAATGPTNRGQRTEPKGRPVEVEAKLKFPELSGREQEITVWVTRAGAPVPGAAVTLESRDGDDLEPFRQLDPTNADGWTRRAFDVRHEKGTVELQVEATAPDGGEGRATVTYFRR